MTKNQKKQHRQSYRANVKGPVENIVAASRFPRLKDLSKRLLHDYVIPMTRIIEHRLQRLEQSL